MIGDLGPFGGDSRALPPERTYRNLQVGEMTAAKKRSGVSHAFGAIAVDPGGATSGRTFYEDRRAAWRVTWTLALGFLLVAGLMRTQGVGMWPLFAGIAGLLLWIGGVAWLAKARPLLAVLPEGLRVYAGSVGLGGLGGAAEAVIPWEAVKSVAYDERRADRGAGGEPMVITTLSFAIGPEAVRPDERKGFLVKLAERRAEWALGEHLVWNPEARKLDLLARPRGGHAKLTAAITESVPRLADPSRGRRRGLGGPLSYAVYDLLLTVVVLGSAALLATDSFELYLALAKTCFAWGGRVDLL